MYGVREKSDSTNRFSQLSASNKMIYANPGLPKLWICGAPLVAGSRVWKKNQESLRQAEEPRIHILGSKSFSTKFLLSVPWHLCSITHDYLKLLHFEFNKQISWFSWFNIWKFMFVSHDNLMLIHMLLYREINDEIRMATTLKSCGFPHCANL